MTKPHTYTPLKNPFTWLWFILGASMSPFIIAQSSMAFAAWLAPVFLLRFSRTVRAKISLPIIGMVIFFSSWIAFRNDFMPIQGSERILTLVSIALAYVVVYGLDNFFSKRLTGVISTLVFPLASTAIGFLATIGNPLGTAGSEAYSQVDLSLLQIVSVTGIWGLVFLLAWFASIVNVLWEKDFHVRSVYREISLFAIVFIFVIIFGSIRTTFFSDQDETVKVAMIAPDRELNNQSIVLHLSESERAAIQKLNDDLFTRSEQKARVGAKIIVWSEATAKIFKEDEADFLLRAKNLAKKEQVYLQVGVQTFAGKDKLQTENRAIMITPTGKIAWDYHKAKPTPGDIEKPGDGVMPTINTPYGKLATVICQDDFFPELVKQAGKKDVDILFDPSSDWETVAEYHSRIATFRAIENGVSMIRPTRKGVSLAVSPVGKTIAHKADYFVGKDQALVAYVPTKGISSIYPHIGDGFAYLSIVGLGGLMLIPVIRKQYQ